MLPALPTNLIRDQANDGKKMQTAFSTNAAYRASLEVRGLLEQFDQFHENIDPQTSEQLSAERHSDMFWRFMHLYYQIKDQENGQDDNSDIEVDAAGIDRFIIRSDETGGTDVGMRILRATAETLVDFLGDNAGAFLAKSPNKLMLATLLREFAAQTNLEEDRPVRILRLLVGSFAVAAADHGADVTDKPAAVLLVASLGHVRRDLGDDFAARIVSHAGFTAVLSDWLGRVAKDPYLVEMLAESKGLENGAYDPTDPTTLPAKLQPLFGALQNTLGVIGDHIGAQDALEGEDVFRAVFQSVLNGMAEHSGALFREKLVGDRFVAELLQSTIKTIGRTGTVRNDDLIAPVFDTLLAQLARTIPEIGQDRALSRAEILLRGLAERISTGEFQLVLSDLETRGGSTYARGLLAELFDIAVSSRNLLLEGESERTQAIFVALLSQVQVLLDIGLTRKGALQLLEAVARQYYSEDTAEGAFAHDILPLVISIIPQLTQGRIRVRAEDVETALFSWIAHFELDRPVWQQLHDAGHLESIVSTLASKLAGDTVPNNISPITLFEIVDAAFGVFARHGIKTSDLADASDDPTSFLKHKLGEIIAQAVNTAFDNLGIRARSADLPQFVRKILDKALSAETLRVLNDDDLRDIIEKAVEEFELM